MENRKPNYIKWILIGCGFLVVLGLICFISITLIFGGIFGGVMGAIKNSDAYKLSVKLVEKSPLVHEKIGDIKSYGWFPSGNVNVNGTTGYAKLSISVTGEKGKGNLETELTKTNGKWHFTKAVFYPEGSGEINLLKKK